VSHFVVSTLSPHVAAALAQDTGRSTTDGVTSKAALSGTTDAFATVRFTVDGTAISETVMADAAGNWTFTPTGLTDGRHTIVASESNVFGVTASSAVDFMLDTMGPVVTEISENGGILTGAGDPNATVRFTVDGTASTAVATADATGHWSMDFTDLTAGPHAVVATEIDDAGNLGSASLSLDVPLHAPTFSALSVGDDGAITLTGNTGEAGDTISLYDGYEWLGFATTDATGTWSFMKQAAVGTEHSFGYNATRPSGETERSDGKALVGGASTTALTGTDGRDLIDGHGADAVITGAGGADRLVAGSGHDTFAYQATTDSTAANSDTITGFQHGVDKIDFSAIAGVTQYQGALAGTGPLTLNAGSVATLEVGGNTLVLANTSTHAETITAADTHGADMTITLVGVHLGLTADDFQHR
jgi:Ca2+-binding RTX toxin-like protein